LICFKAKIKGIIYLAKYLILVIVLVIIFIVLSSEKRKDILSLQLEYGFELFFNYQKTGEFSSRSSDELLSMYDTFPTNLKTLLIGDGYFFNPTNPAKYYMNTDVGYARLLFYFGIVGSFCFFVYHVLLAWLVNLEVNRYYVHFFSMVVILFFVVNIKGYIDFTPFFSIFLFSKQSC
jgi:hypothetical protein